MRLNWPKILILFTILAFDASAFAQGGRGGRWGDENGRLELAVVSGIGSAAQTHEGNCNARSLATIIEALLRSYNQNEYSHRATAEQIPIGPGANRCLREAFEVLVREGITSSERSRSLQARFRD